MNTVKATEALSFLIEPLTSPILNNTCYYQHPNLDKKIIMKVTEKNFTSRFHLTSTTKKKYLLYTDCFATTLIKNYQEDLIQKYMTSLTMKLSRRQKLSQS